MQFNDVLNRYMEQVGCTAKELSDASGVSPAVISRYRSGERVPGVESPQMMAIARGIAECSRKGKGRALASDDVHRAFLEAIAGVTVNYEYFLVNLKTLAKSLSISNSDLAQALLFDPSYISRILAGQRRPADMPQFLSVVSGYAAKRCQADGTQTTLAKLIGCNEEDVADESRCARAIEAWLASNINPQMDSLAEFMREVDAFDFEEFARSLHQRGAMAPMPLPGHELARVYTGPQQMQAAKIEFLKAMVDSRAKDDVITYSDMPIIPERSDPEFQKAMLYYLGILLERGQRLRTVRDIHRSFEETMVDLQGMLPIYMSGLVAPFYFHEAQGGVFRHLLWVSGTIALAGEAVSGHMEDCHLVLTREPEAVSYYRRRAEQLLEHAEPLLEVYRQNDQEAFTRFRNESIGAGRSWHIMLPNPPVCTASAELLGRILAHNDIPAAEGERIVAFAKDQRKGLERILGQGAVHLEVPDIAEAEAREHPLILPLSHSFYERDVVCTYEEYREHVELTRAFAAERPSCTLALNPHPVFRNIEILVCDNSRALVSRNRTPAVHLAILQPDIVAAIRAFMQVPE